MVFKAYNAVKKHFNALNACVTPHFDTVLFV